MPDTRGSKPGITLTRMDDFEAEQDEARLMAEALPTEMAESASALHECYVSWVEAGFSEKQALWLVGSMVTASHWSPPDS